MAVAGPAHSMQFIDSGFPNQGISGMEVLPASSFEKKKEKSFLIPFNVGEAREIKY